MRKTLLELAQLVEGEVVGDKQLLIQGVAKPEEAREGEIALATSEKFLRQAQQSQASAVIVSLEVKDFPKPIIRVGDPRLAFAQILELFAPQGEYFKGIHSTVVLGKRLKIGKNISIGPYVVVEDDVKLDDNICLSAFVYLGRKVEVGKDTRVSSRVTIMDNTIIGRRVIIHPGTVIGSDGFGFARQKDGSYYKIPQLGRVVIEDDVEIGANVAIDRATLGETRIGRGSKIDNLVHVAHNVTVGENVAIVALVGISGSSTIGKGVILAGQAGVTDHVRVEENVVVAAKSGVTKNIAANQFVSGFPARPHAKQKKIKAIINRLPHILQRIEKLEKMSQRGVKDGVPEDY